MQTARTVTRSPDDNTAAQPERYRYALLALHALRDETAFEPIGLVPDDVEVIPTFSGEPDRMEAWLIYADRARASQAHRVVGALRERAAEVLAQAGFPGDALRSFRLNLTSIDDIEERGGRRAFFR